MDLQSYVDLVRSLGPSGIFVAFMLYDRNRADKRLEKLDELAEKRTAADIEVAKSLAMLTAAIGGLRR